MASVATTHGQKALKLYEGSGDDERNITARTTLANTTSGMENNDMLMGPCAGVRFEDADDDNDVTM
jgi:hypothetical protein